MSSQHNQSTHGPPYCTLFLDWSLSSNLLGSKIRNIPHKHKFETIMKPILEFYFGTSDQDELYYNRDKKKVVIPNSLQFKLQLDFIRDGNFIIDQILDLPLIYIQILAQEFGLWKDRSFVLSALNHQLDIIKYTDSFNNDMEVMMTSVREFCNSVTFSSQELLDNDEFVKFAILNGSIMSYFPIRFKKYRALVQLAIKVNSYK